MMTDLCTTRTLRLLPALLLAATLAACDSSSDPLAPDLDDLGPQAPAVVVGSVSVPTASLVAGPSLASAADLSGVLVTVEGGTAADTTDSAGTFRVEATSSDGRIVLRFRKGSLDARLELEGVGAGMLIRVNVTLNDDSVSLSDSSSGDRNEFEGMATAVAVSGDAPERTLQVSIADTAGAVLVDIVEGVTTFDAEGDLVGFESTLAALEAGRAVKIEGEGTLQSDGSVTAAQVKVETDDDGDGDDDGDDDEFEGRATFVSVSGDAPARTLRVEIADTAGAVLVDILEGITTFDNEGDILSFGDALAALEAGVNPKIEGHGARRDDGSFAASDVKVETDEDDGDDDENEFEGRATLVSVAGEAPARTVRVEIADSIGTVMVDLVEGATRFDNEGDFTSFNDVLAALQAGTALEMEGEGTLQDDGAIAATEVKVETDD